MIRNGSFDEGGKGWQLGRFATVAEVEGGKILRVADTDGRAGADTYGDPIPVEPGTLYTLSARLRYEGSDTALVYVRDYKATKQIATQRAVLTTGKRKPGEWHVVSADWQPLPDSDNVRLWIHSANGAVGTYELDDIRLVPAKGIDVAEFFEGAVGGHPRIYLRKGRLDRVRRNLAHDPNAQKASKVILAYADTLLTAKPIAYVKTGMRMLGPARETVERIKYLGMAYHLSGERKYAQKGIEVLMAAAAIPHWNPSHYLDAAGMCLATGIGYDWFHPLLTEEQRKTVVDAIVRKGIAPSFQKQPWWVNGKSNWNQVCNSGLGIAALAIWEDEPELAAQTIKRSLQGIPHTMGTYAPDGIYFEGPSYWAYGTTYTVEFIDALETALGKDFGLPDFPGFLTSIDAINFITGPTGLFLNFSDGYRYRYTQAVSYWFAQRRHDPNLLFIENECMSRSLTKMPGKGQYPDMVMYLLWSDQAQTAEAPRRRYWHGLGRQPIATFRSSWERDATFAAMKGGVSGGGHQHMDVGGFVIDADGVRWASDAPSQTYDLEANARKKAKAEGKPFERAFYRERWSHNILVVDGKRPVYESQSPMLSFSDSPTDPNVIFDLLPSYKGQIARARRGLRLVGERCVVVQDEFTTLDQPGTRIRWAMLTLNSAELSRADISDNGRRLVLRQSAQRVPERQEPKTMEMRILSPAEAAFDVLVTNDQSYIHYYDRISDDARQVVIELQVPANSERTLAVSFRPGSVSEEPDLSLTPLAQWAGARPAAD